MNIFVPTIKLFLNIYFLGNKIDKPRALNTRNWQLQQYNWNWASSSTDPPTKATIKESVDLLGPSFVPPVLSSPPSSVPTLKPNRPFLSNVSF